MRYEAPTTTEQAVQLLTTGGSSARVLAGGTDLIVQMNAERVDPDLVVDIKRIASMRSITESGGAFIIGAAVSGVELREHAALRAVWPGVVEAANLIGSKQVQGRATLGCNLCNASPAADSVPAMIAAGVTAIVVGPQRRRSLAVEDVVLGPRRTALAVGELIEAFEFPKRPPRSADAYLRFTPRTEMDIAVVGCGVSLTLDTSGAVVAARVSLGAVAARPLLVPAAETAIVGTRLEGAALAALEAAAGAACSPIDDKRGTKEFRIQIAGVLARRTALIAYPAEPTQGRCLSGSWGADRFLRLGKRNRRTRHGTRYRPDRISAAECGPARNPVLLRPQVHLHRHRARVGGGAQASPLLRPTRPESGARHRGRVLVQCRRQYQRHPRTQRERIGHPDGRDTGYRWPAGFAVHEPSPPLWREGVGEVPIVPPLAAIANAVRRATGIRFTELPLSPPRVAKALRERQS